MTPGLDTIECEPQTDRKRERERRTDRQAGRKVKREKCERAEWRMDTRQRGGGRRETRKIC